MVKVKTTKTKNRKSNDSNSDESNSNEESSHASKKTKNESSLLKDCNKLFYTNNLYEVLSLKKTASLNDIKKAYHKISLKVHPDKVEESLKEESKIKFQTIGKVYSILSDDGKRKIYDETGAIEGENEFLNDDCDWDGYFKNIFKKVTQDDVIGFFDKYKSSTEEKDDLLRLYNKHQGDMDKIMQEMFSESVLDDEDRFKSIIQRAIDKKEILEYEAFKNDEKEKKEKRRIKYEKEAKMAKELKKKLGLDSTETDLAMAIAQNSEMRKKKADAFLENIEKKYSKDARKSKTKSVKKLDEQSEDESSASIEEDDDDDDFEIEAKGKGKKKAAVPTRTTPKRNNLKKKYTEEDEDSTEDDDDDFEAKKKLKKGSPVKQPKIPEKVNNKKKRTNTESDNEEISLDENSEDEDKPIQKKSKQNIKEINQTNKRTKRSINVKSYEVSDSEEDDNNDDDDDDDVSFHSDDDDDNYGSSKSKKKPSGKGRGKGVIKSASKAKKVKRL